MLSAPCDILDLSRFKSLILNTCGLTFSQTREKTLSEALRQRMTASGTSDPDAYFNLIVRDQAEFDRLVTLLTVNETYFFREPSYLNLVVDRLIPELLAISPSRPPRLLSAGCATGEEPYSIAIMLRERYGPRSAEIFSVTGVDIDEPAIEVARAGMYGKNSFRGVDASLIARYFEPCESGRWKLKTGIRNSVTFEVVNLMSGLYPASMLGADIIFYRNVSIYFPSPVQRNIFTRLADLLRDGGCLMVGASETLQHDIGVLTLVEQEGLFFYRKLPGFSIEERRSTRRHPPFREETKTAFPRPPVRPMPMERRPGEGSPGRRTSPVPDRPVQPIASGQDETVKALFDDALELAVTDRFTDALSVLDTLIASDSAFLKAHVLSASILLTLSRFEDSRAACETALSLNSFCLEAYLMLGIIERHEGNDDEAHKRFREAIYLSPSCWLAHVHMAELAFARKDWKPARSGYSAALKVLESGSLADHGREYPPLIIKAEPFLVICRHKLTLLKGKG
ncbi:MAG: CheR family methyltransferase [Pseudomonadota bacterium]